MELRQLEYFVAVSDSKNFTRAAEKCCISQPAITMAINSLENELNLKLFLRTKRGVELTTEGKVFYNYISHVLHELDCTKAQMDILREKKTHIVRVAVSPLVCADFLPLWRDINQSQDRITVVLVECERERAEALLDSDDVDFAIVTGKESNIAGKKIVLQKGWWQFVSRKPFFAPALDSITSSCVLVAQDCAENLIPNFIGTPQCPVQRVLSHDWNSIITGDTVALLPNWITVDSSMYISPIEPAIESSIMVLYKKDTHSLECLKFLNHLILNFSNDKG